MDAEHHPVLLIGLFVLGLSIIHHVSIEKAIAESADDYCQALLDSTRGWHEDGADPWPWLGYFA